MLWRGVTEAEPFLTGRSMVMIGHDTLKFVAYPIDADPARRGRVLINWIAERRVGADYVHAREDWNRRGDAERLHRALPDVAVRLAVGARPHRARDGDLRVPDGRSRSGAAAGRSIA